MPRAHAILVSPSSNLRQFLRQAIERLIPGVAITEVPSAYAGVLDQDPPPHADLLVLDSPSVGLLDVVRAHMPRSCPILILTQEPPGTFAPDASGRPMAVLEKPFQISGLRAALQQLNVA